MKKHNFLLVLAAAFVLALTPTQFFASEQPTPLKQYGPSDQGDQYKLYAQDELDYTSIDRAENLSHWKKVRSRKWHQHQFKRKQQKQNLKNAYRSCNASNTFNQIKRKTKKRKKQFKHFYRSNENGSFNADRPSNAKMKIRKRRKNRNKKRLRQQQNSPLTQKSPDDLINYYTTTDDEKSDPTTDQASLRDSSSCQSTNDVDYGCDSGSDDVMSIVDTPLTLPELVFILLVLQKFDPNGLKNFLCVSSDAGADIDPWDDSDNLAWKQWNKILEDDE